MLNANDIKRLNLIKSKLDRLKPGEWKLWVEGRDHTSGDTVITRENDEDLYINSYPNVKVGIDDLEFIADSKSNIEFLLELVKKLT